MQVVILCGGRGTRMWPETSIRPKPMVEIGGRPILWHIMKSYAHFGINEFILCLGYKGEVIRNYFLNYGAYENDITVVLGQSTALTHHSDHDELGWKITMVNTGDEALTGARVKRIERYIEGERFMLTYGDGVADVPLDRLVEFHGHHGRIATVCAVHPPARFGELSISRGEVTTFSEKPQTSQGMINGGFFVLEHGVFDYLDDDDACAFEHAPMARLAETSELMAYRHEGFWQCADTVRELDVLRRLWESGDAPWAVGWRDAGGPDQTSTERL